MNNDGLDSFEKVKEKNSTNKKRSVKHIDLKYEDEPIEEKKDPQKKRRLIENSKSPSILTPRMEESSVKMPNNWEKVYGMIKEMRKEDRGAAVDTMGIHIHFNPKDALSSKFHVLISAMLSSQTKDEVNGACMERLKALPNGGLSVHNLVKMSQEELSKHLYPVGFYNIKAKNIKKTCEILLDKYKGDIPSTLDEMLALPGVGPKMGILVMQVAQEKYDVGICVDVHVHRISNRLGWVKTWNHSNVKNQDPDKTRLALEKWLPKDKWFEINHMLVGFGQTICPAINPKCNECTLKSLCPSYSSGNIKK